jgi:hypothetical protein
MRGRCRASGAKPGPDGNDNMATTKTTRPLVIVAAFAGSLAIGLLATL